MANVKFYNVALQSTYDTLATKEANALYFIQDTQRLYHCELLMGTGKEASETAAGLLSAKDYKKLQELITTGGTVDLTPVDGTIVIEDKKIGVQLSAVDGNALSIVDDGLFVASVDLTDVKNRLTAVEGSITQLQADIVGGIHYKGPVATVDDLPANAKQGDLYEVTADGSEWCYNGENWFEYGSAHFVPVAGDGIQIDGNKIAVKIAENANGLHFVDGSLDLALATQTSAGAMSAADKVFIDSIPSIYASRAEMNAIAQRVKYEVFSKPVGTTAKVTDNEIRICCAANTAWAEQAVGTNGDPNSYYVGLKIYAPVGCDHFMEDLNKTIEDDTVFDFTDEFSGRDSYGNGYSLVWLPVAAKQEDGTWKYYGDMSTADKMIGWYYTSAFYDASDNLLSKETIRINLVNENMDTEIIPYYMNNYATKEALETLENNISWGEL